MLKLTSLFHKAKRNESGFTLAEVVIAAGIIAGVITAFTLFLANIASIQDSAALDRIATRVMASELAKVGGAHWDDLMVPPSSGTVSPCVISPSRTSYQSVQGGPVTLKVDGLNVSVLRSVVWANTVGQVTNAVGNGTTITYTVPNTFAIGNVVSIYGVYPSTYNVTDAVVTSSTASAFTISNSGTGTFVPGTGYAGLSVYCSGTKDSNDLKVVTVTVSWLDSQQRRMKSTSLLRSKWTSGVPLS